MNKLLLCDLKLRKSKLVAFSLFVALFMMTASAFAQVEIDKVRIVPTVADDPTTAFLFATHVTDTAPGNTGTDLIPIDGDKIDFGTTGAWIEYQIISPLGGDFLVEFTHGVRNVQGVEINMGVYKTETETWPETGAGDTAKIVPGGNWNASGPYYCYLGTLEAGVYYTLRINHLNSNGTNGYTGNMYSINVKEVSGSIDATLSDLKINGTTIEGFDPEVTVYNMAMPAGVWVSSMEATANHDSATVVVPEEFPLEGNTATYTVTVTSEAGISKIYSLSFAAPIEIYDGLVMEEDNWPANNVYYNQGTRLRGWGINNYHNNDYIDLYVFSYYDDNLRISINYTNGYGDSESYFNVSTLGVNDTDWTLQDIYTQPVPPTYDDANEAQWDPAADWAQDVDFVFALKAEEPMLLRIYGITNKNNVANVQSLSFELLNGSIDATLSDLKVDGSTVEGFDPMTTSYSVPLPAAVASATVAATANDGDAQVTGTGAVDILGIVTTDTVMVTAEEGNTIKYMVNLVTPFEVTFEDMDTMMVGMADSIFFNNGVNATNSKLNNWSDTDYLDYYLYSATDKNVQLMLNVANGNSMEDTVYAKLNVSTFVVGNDWVYDEANDIDIANTGSWHDSTAVNVVTHNLRLNANQPVMLRLYGMTNGAGTGDVYSMSFVEGTAVGVESLETNEIKVWGGTGKLNVHCDETFIGGSIEVFDITGRTVIHKMVESTRNEYGVSRTGIYIVRAIDRNKVVRNTKCFVK